MVEFEPLIDDQRHEDDIFRSFMNISATSQRPIFRFRGILISRNRRHGIP